MDTLFFWMSKFLWKLVSPLNFIFLLLLLAWVLLLLGKSRAGLALNTTSIIFLLIIAVFPVGSMLLVPLENRFPSNPDLPDDIEGIIVLSGSLITESSVLRNQVQASDAFERHLAFMELARKYPDALLVFTGGSSRIFQQKYKAADVAKGLYATHGPNPERVIFERLARNTWENANFSQKLVKPQLKRPWILITSAFHMPRAVGIFCRIGWPVIAFPVDYKTPSRPNLRPGFNLSGHMLEIDMAIHEWLGLLAYRLSGKTDSLLPDSC